MGAWAMLMYLLVYAFMNIGAFGLVVMFMSLAALLEQGDRVVASRDLFGSCFVILDELGYVPFSKAGAELLFEIVSRAYERLSLIVTTNLPFENWVEVLGSERLTGATLDRLTHRCHILETGNHSYRFKASSVAARNRAILSLSMVSGLAT